MLPNYEKNYKKQKNLVSRALIFFLITVGGADNRSLLQRLLSEHQKGGTQKQTQSVNRFGCPAPRDRDRPLMFTRFCSMKVASFYDCF